jgi:ATP-dependent RNA helicase DeaD
LVRLHRARLPAPEELTDSPPPRMRETRERGVAERGVRPERGPSSERAPRAERGPRPERGTQLADGQAVIFRMNVGRDKAADPRWMIPVICRRGSVTKNEIGEIRIMDSETQFEIAGHAADHFAARLRRPDPKDPEIRIVRLGESLETTAPMAAALSARAERKGPKPDFKKGDFPKKKKLTLSGYASASGGPGLKRRKRLKGGS